MALGLFRFDFLLDCLKHSSNTTIWTVVEGQSVISHGANTIAKLLAAFSSPGECFGGIFGESTVIDSFCAGLNGAIEVANLEHDANSPVGVLDVFVEDPCLLVVV